MAALPARFVVVAALLTPSVGVGQEVCADRDLLYRLDGESLGWSDVGAVSSDDSLLVVLTESYPVLHLFDLAAGAHLRSWGRDGEGPGEFQGSTGVAVVDGHVYALDGTQGRLSIFEPAGNLVRAIRLEDFGVLPNHARRLDHGGGERLLFRLSVPMGDERAIVTRMIGVHAIEDSPPLDTVIVYSWATAGQLRISAEGSPPVTLAPPYAPSPVWTPLSGGVAFWQGPDPEVRILGFDGTPMSVVSLAFDNRLEVTAADREFWLQNAIPQEMFGQRVFEPARREARRTVDFPRYHPLIFELLAGPEDLLWVRRTPGGRDEIWDIMDPQGEPAGRVSLDPGQVLMAVIPDHIVLKVTDVVGVEAVEVHRCMSLPGLDLPVTA